jgi:hypothetical protein
MLSRMIIILSIGKKDSAKMRTAPPPEMQLIEEEVFLVLVEHRRSCKSLQICNSFEMDLA